MRNVVVLSPHLDDGVFSLGARMAVARRDGTRVTLVTAFANDPDDPRPASEWDAEFGTAGAATRARRREDARAARVVGAEPLWLPFPEKAYREDLDEEEIVSALVRVCAGADRVYLPGFPLRHRDHALLNRIVLAARQRFPALWLYVEQPYGAWDLAAPDARLPTELEGIGSIAWQALERRPAAWARKLLASHLYTSQVRLIGRGMGLTIARSERRHGLEPVTALP